MQERENLLRIFQEAKTAFEGSDSAKLKSLSDQTTNTAALTQDPDNIAVAVIIYSLSKIVEREDYKSLPGWNKFYETHIDSIGKKIEALKKGDDEAFRKEIIRIRRAMDSLSGKLKIYIQDVLRKASISKASRIYEHGISMGKTADLLGITLFELASYSGSKEGSEVPESVTIDEKQRVKFAMEMFE